MKMAFHLCDLPQNSNSQSNQEKYIKPTQIKGYSTKYLINTSQNCQNYRKGKSALAKRSFK